MEKRENGKKKLSAIAALTLIALVSNSGLANDKRTESTIKSDLSKLKEVTKTVIASTADNPTCASAC